MVADNYPVWGIKLRKEDVMKSKDYCKIMDMELTGWKAKLYDVINRIDRLPTGDKQRMYENVNALHIIMTELDEKIDQLRTSCPTDWKPEKVVIDSKLADLGSKYGSTANQLFDYDIGG
jgi:hypothetical protein